MTIGKKDKKAIIFIPIVILLCIIGLRFVSASNKKIEKVEGAVDKELFIISKGGDGTYLDGLERYGFMDKNGQVVIEPKYKKVSEFFEGVAYVKDIDDKGYLIDKNENKICSTKGEYIYNYDGLWLMQIDNKYGYMDKKGEWIIEPKFDSIYGFGEDLAAVKENEKWGYMNKKGEWIIEPIFQEVHSFSEGLAPVKENEKWGCINNKGEWIIEPIFQEVYLFSQGLTQAKINEKWGYINKKGEWVINPTFDNASMFKSDHAIIEKYDTNHNLKMGVINKKGEFIMAPKYDDIDNYLFDEGLFVYKEKGLYGVSNSSGETVIEPKYKLSYCENGNKAFVDKDTIYFFDENLKINNQYKVGKVFLFNYDNSLIRVMTKEGSLYFDKYGKLITTINEDYSKAFEIINGLN